ncbi:secretion protein HlyD family protein [Cyanobacterium stanieri PCC 7202]|uniref:Secretion protein HlyD family protein n=1 Tax=Cyanobacterium stanieri (strain ATCC 29140 / PCC 7202) TaxID=292563 RepID=K9YJP0_CYASC|nr:secretion protein HlyD family protein [Cyanobacterium stanieri PCC 7202]
MKYQPNQDQSTNSSEVPPPVEQTKTIPISITSDYEEHSISIPTSNLTAEHPTTIEADWSPSVKTLLDDIPAFFPRQLIIAGIAFCTGFGLWSWYGTVDQISKAQGILVPKGRTYKIETTELIKVNDIAVEEGEEVTAGQLIVELDTELAQQEIIRLENILTTYQAELEQKKSLKNKIENDLNTQLMIASANQMAQEQAILSAQEKRQINLQLLNQLDNKIHLYQQRQKQTEILSSLSQQQLQQLQESKIAHQQRLNRLQPLREVSAVSQDFIFNAEHALRETEQQITHTQMQEVATTREQLFQARQILDELQAEKISEQGNLLQRNREIEQLQAQLAVKQGEAESIAIQGKQNIQQIELEITQLLGRISDTENILLGEKAKLNNKYLRAPVNGVVLSLNLENEGVVVQPGQTLAEIVPHGVPLVVSAIIPNHDAGFIEQGMPVQVKIDAFPYQDFGVVAGNVTHISANSEVHEQLGNVYQLEIELESNHITKNQEIVPFKPGQTASADILIRRRRIIDVLLDPIKKIQKDGIAL